MTVAGAPVRGLGSLAEDIERRLFTPASAGGSTRLGIEVEMLPVDRDTRQIASLDPDAPVSSLRLLRRLAGEQLWEEEVSSAGVSTFQLPDFGTLSYEPGGQLEYSSPPCATATELVRRVRGLLVPLRDAARADGIDMLFTGIDPYNSLECAPLQLFTERYCRMADYFARLSPAGGRMMRQTAAIQVNLELGERPLARWRVLNAAAPYLSAIFANSPVYAGRSAGRPSQRAHTWRSLDSSRTGLPYSDGAPVAAYLEFALCAPDLLRTTPAGDYRPFVGWIERGEATAQQWSAHLTTLFPEVRPRGWFEVRSADTLPPEWLAAPLALLSGIAYDARTLADADALLGDPDLATLRTASDVGMGDQRIASVARDLFAVALEGCERLGPRFMHPSDLEEAVEFFRRFTARGRTPGDERQDLAAAS